MTGVKMNCIDWFFREPSTPRIRPNTFSQLYLLRCDIEICFGVDPATGALIHYKAVWPGVMGILAGIDLLGKFLAGNDKTGKSGLQGVRARFINFLKRYFRLSDSDADIIYQLRNSLLHSFGLYSEDNRGKVYKFVLHQGLGPFIQKEDGDIYVIDIQQLRTLFKNAIAGYQTDMIDTARADYQELQENFDRMLRKHGGIRI